MNRLESRGFTLEEIETVIKNIDNITKISSARLDPVQESLDNNRAAIKEQATEQEREEGRKAG